jgi:hypothetical protein
MLRDALIELNHRFFPGSRTDSVPGGVSWWFKQDEVHQATHVHDGPEFLPWHREIVNRLEEMLRVINPQLSLHYWDWTQDPTNVPNANLGGGVTGNLNLFTADFMGYGGATSAPIGEPWASAGYYAPGANPHRDGPGGTPADPPQTVVRNINSGIGPAQAADDANVLAAANYQQMRTRLENIHNDMHGYVNMGGQHISFRDPFVFLLHSNVDRLFAQWQTDPAHPDRLNPAAVYGAETPSLNVNVEPWSTGHSFAFGQEHFTRPWFAPENQGSPHTYLHPSVVFPPCYDTNGVAMPMVQVLNPGAPPVINFNDVPTGETAVRAAIFRVYGCATVTVRVLPGAGPAAPFSVLSPASGSITVAHTAHQFVDVRIWLAYTAGAAGVPVADGSATFECVENGQQFTFTLKANAINRPRVGVMLALDQSGSMDWAAGASGATRLQVLKDAARKFMELVPQNNGVGLIRFDHNSYAVNDPTFPGLEVTKILSNTIFDPGRVAAIAAVNAHATNPAGNTSVGDGVDRARQVLNALPAAEYDQKALVVLTDGLENEPLFIADVTGSIDSRTFAIGLGNEHQVNTAALSALANSTGGYLLLTGLLTASIDDYFRLSKYFMQILAGVTNTSIIVDPNGYLAPGSKVRVPFHVTEADIDCTVLLMTDENVIDLALETPDGTVIDAAAAGGLAIEYNEGEQTRHYRFTLPVAVGAGQREGAWHALLQVNERHFKRALSQMRDKEQERAGVFATHGARYSVVAQAYSNLRMAATVEQDSYEPGAQLTFQAVLREYDLPVEGRARAWVELNRPNGTAVTLPMTEVEPGVFEATTTANVSGLHHARVMAEGVTLRGMRFTREQLVTAAIWKGGDNPYQPPRGSEQDSLCNLIACLIGENVLSREFEERLRKEGIHLDHLRRCLGRACGKRGRRLLG